MVYAKAWGRVFRPRDILKAHPELSKSLCCGEMIYDKAVVLKTEPLVLVSVDGKMRWNNYSGTLLYTGERIGFFKYLKLLYKRGKK